jgi:hypothetical protein
VRQGDRRRGNDREKDQCGLGSKRHDLSPVIALQLDGNPRRTVRRTERAPFP